MSYILIKLTNNWDNEYKGLIIFIALLIDVFFLGRWLGQYIHL